MRRFVEGIDRGQTTLFPECLEDWIGEDNPVRVIDAFVEELDLADWDLTGSSLRPPGGLRITVGAAEALHLRLSQSGAVEPAA